MKDQTEQEAREIEFAIMGQQVVENRAYQEAMTIRKAQLFNDFCKSKPDEQDKRDEAWRTMQNINALEDWFNTLLTTGRMARQQVEARKDQSAP